jgi:hypothetical protein
VSWWRYTNAVIEAMARDDDTIPLTAVLRRQCALVGNGNLVPDDFKAMQKSTSELVQLIFNVVKPWAATEASGSEGDVAGLINAYKQAFGDPADPVFREKLRQDMAYLEKLRRGEIQPEPVPETAEQRIFRLIAERDAKQKQKLSTRAARGR